MYRDKDFWKKKYEDSWDDSSRREIQVKEMVANLGFKLERFGLGAESTEFIPGSAEDNGCEKGAPDYHIKNSNIYIEVTGPLTNNVKKDSPIWIRPDKIDYAYKYKNKHDEFFVVNYLYANVWYVIHFNEELSKYYIESTNNNSDYKLIHPRIRGVIETYVGVSRVLCKSIQ